MVNIKNELLEDLKKTGALDSGHFILSSGLHSTEYVQCAKLLQHPELASKYAMAVASAFEKMKVDSVIGPAMGGIVLGYETARHLKTRAIFAERDSGGDMRLRRGFTVRAGERVLVVEDVITTGKSVEEVISLIGEQEAVIAGTGCLIDRSGGRYRPAGIFRALLAISADAYPPDECPMCAKGIPSVKPGSRR